MKYDILNRFSGTVIFTAEIDCSDDTLPSIKLGLAVKVAVKARANLTGANLAGAYLTRANLTGAYLTDANLTGANLAGANLTGANLTGAYLTDANLTGANLAGAYLTDANLTGANLAGAYLTRANLTGAYLTDANLTGANLTGANLAGAYLTDANLAGAYLTRANLTGANLAGAYLTRANLTGAYLTDANLTGANLAGANGLKTQPAQTIILPEGDLIVYKKLVEGVAKLKIPSDAKRSNATGRKCRAEYAKVIELPEGVKIGHSKHNDDFEYKVGKIVRPDKWDGNWADECSNGIHFFITKEEAESY